MRLDHLLSKDLSRGCSAVVLPGKRLLCSHFHSAPHREAILIGAWTTSKFLAAMRLWGTRVPIPNTRVKTQPADGTMLETAWESRWLPELKKYHLRNGREDGK